MTKPNSITKPTTKTQKAIPARGELRFDVAGHRFKLMPSFENIAAVEDVTDCGLYELAGLYREGKLRLRHMGAIFVTVAEPPIAPEALKAMIEKEGMAQLSAALGAFLVAAITGGEDAKTAGKKRAAKS